MRSKVEIRDGETATQAIIRHQEEQAVIQAGVLTARDIDLFTCSELSWTQSPSGLMVLPLYKKERPIRGFAIHVSGPDLCTLYRLDEAGYDYQHKRIIHGVSVEEAKAKAEKTARDAGVYLGARKDQAWRNGPPSDGRRKKLWAMGYRSTKMLNAIRTNGEAANLISCLQADRALAAILQQESEAA